MKFDIVIPCHSKDYPVLINCINGIKKHIKNYRNIYLVSATDLQIEGTKFIAERLFDQYIKLDDIREIWKSKNPALQHRSNWIYQQLLKLGAHLIIDDLLENYLCLDSDVLILKPIDFIDTDGNFLYSKAREYHQPYVKTYTKLKKEAPVVNFSFICHHMMFKQVCMVELLADLESLNFKNWVEAILAALDYNENSTFSEWDLYGNWMLKKYPNICINKQRCWGDINFIPNESQKNILMKQYDFVGIHAWMRNPDKIDGWL